MSVPLLSSFSTPPVPCRCLQGVSHTILYPSSGGPEGCTRPCRCATCQAVSLGALMGLWDYPRVAKGGWSWVKGWRPLGLLIGPKACGSPVQGCWQAGVCGGHGSGTTSVGKTSSCRRACVWCLLSPSASPLGFGADPMLWASFQGKSCGRGVWPTQGL